MVRALVRGGAETASARCGRPGHHAMRDQAMGFCLFNNVAIAAELAIRELGLRRVFILDWDVHHGNGTADIFRRRSDVLFASIHEGGIYPGSGRVSDCGSGEGRGYTINVPVPRGAGEEVWLSVLEHVIVPAAPTFHPELILVSAGFDAHRADPLAGCRLDAGSFAQMTCHVRGAGLRASAHRSAWCSRAAMTAGALADSVLATIGALNGQTKPVSIAPDPVVTARVAAHVGHFWNL